LSTEGALEPWRTLTILSQIGSALDAAHAEGLVHRDVKPGNILLAQPGTALERAYLSDFGVTKRIDPATALTRTGQFVGTVDYVAPEQILAEAIDGRTDIYSVGCVLYECLTGQPPFQRPTDVATIYAHLQDRPPTIDDDSFPGMQGVIHRALARSKDDRYPTCSALVEATRSGLPDAGPSNAAAELDGAPPGAGRSAIRRLIVMAAAAVLVAAIVAGAALETRRSPTVAVSSGPPTSAGPHGSSPAPGGPIVWGQASWNEFGGNGGDVAFTSSVLLRDGHVVAVGHVDQGSNEDAVAWTQRGARWKRNYVSGLGSTGSQRIDGIAQVGSRLIAVGYDDLQSAAWYSDDFGKHWHTATGMIGAKAARTVALAPDGIIWALGEDGVWTSVTNGATWTQMHIDAFPAGSDVWAVAGDGNRLVAVGLVQGTDGYSDPAVWTFENGSWTRVASDVFAEPGGQFLRDVAVSPDGTWVAVGDDQETNGLLAFRSQDGVTWTRSTVPSGLHMETVTYLPPGDGARFVAGGQLEPTTGGLDAGIWTSVDGVSWTRERGLTLTGDLSVGRAPLEIRSLVAYHSPGVSVLAFGVVTRGSAENARLWNGSVSNSG
jgi:hypothetical protein